MFDLYTSVEQEQRLAQALDERNEQADQNSDLAAKGRFDGLIGLKPDKKLVAEQWYWQEYQYALQEYWFKQYGIEITHEF